MAQDRCLLLGGPCVIQTCDATYVTTTEGVRLEAKVAYRKSGNSLLGDILQFKTDQTVSVKFTPIGNPAYAPTLYPLGVSDIGSDLYGCTDCFLRIKGQDGGTIEFKACGVLKPPPIRLSPTKGLFGEVEFGCVVANNFDLTTAGKVLLSTTGNAFVIPADAYDPTKVVERPCTVRWGPDTGGNPFRALSLPEDGLEFSVEYETEPVKTVLSGTIGARLKGMVAKAKFKPISMSVADFFTMIPLEGAAAAIGAPPGKREDLVINHSPSAGGLTISLAKAHISEEGGSMEWKQASDRMGEVTLISSVAADAGTGALIAPFTITVNPAS